MVLDINKNEFDDATQTKLEIFRECFKEWLPVFIHNHYIKKIYVYDFFAGSGKDITNRPGSPLILLDEAMGKNQMYCSNVKTKKVEFIFNEAKKAKSFELRSNVEEHLKSCLGNCNRPTCVYGHYYPNYEFKDLFSRPKLAEILNNRDFGKFILLDQYGLKEVNDEIFLKLVNSPKTDFIFFIASNFINRFKNHPNVIKHLRTESINFDETKPKECHKEVANYFRKLISPKKEYYIHHFTIKKGSNYYGLIFGSGHTFGMEKFLKVCWNEDKLAGEANFNLNNDFEVGTFFYSEENSNKREEIKIRLEKKILSGEIETNIEGFKYTMKLGGLTSIFIDVMNDLLKNQKVKIEGRFNRKKTDLHRFKDEDIYKIKLR